MPFLELDHDRGLEESALVSAYRDRENIVEPTIQAAEALMSIGEMVEALSEVHGQQELRQRGGFILRLY